MRLHHVNVVVAPAGTEAVVPFYVLLGMKRVAKPNDAPGAWFDLPDGSTQLHVSERQGTRHPQQHFALAVEELDNLSLALQQAGHPWHPGTVLFGARRGMTADPAGNAIELIEAIGPFA